MIYESLLSAYGPQQWWPGSTPFEVIVGAILTQRVAWSNVEKADAIILYAAGKPSFVVDAYTKRILSRLGLIEEKESYRVVRDLFMENLPLDVSLYNEYHALLVRHGKERCRSQVSLCVGCPLEESCLFASRG